MKFFFAEETEGCMRAAYSPVSTELSEHVEAKYQLVVDHVLKGSVEV